jgi:ABC-type dipeptide/oligopeptide/nickel transport system ATPase component
VNIECNRYWIGDVNFLNAVLSVVASIVFALIGMAGSGSTSVQLCAMDMLEKRYAHGEISVVNHACGQS